MNDYRYILDTSPKKFRCPECGKKRFVRYTDSHTGNYLSEEYGRCDREQNCRYHLSPYEDDYHKEQWKKENAWKQPVKPDPKPEPKYIPVELFKKSQSNYTNNNFVKYLLTLFDNQTVKQVIKKYHLGTSSKITGGCIFYQVDINRRVRRGKIIVYTGGRRGRIDSVGNQLNISKKYYPSWRFFGGHLLNDSEKPVAIVESEKTAIISSIYFPEFTWLATGNKSTLKKEYAQSLQGRNVTLFPDLGAFEDWKNKAIELAELCHVTVSDLLEIKACAKDTEKGYDLADYLTGFNPDKFKVSYHVPPRAKPLELKYESPKNGTPSIKLNSAGYPSAWDEIQLTPGTQEAAEAKRHALNDCDTEFERLKILDPKVALLEELFDAEPITEIELS